MQHNTLETSSRWTEAVLVLGLAVVLGQGAAFATDGHVLHGVGPVNESMGGAGTAAIIEPIGALAWNPAGMQTLRRGWTIGLGATYFMPTRTLSSSVPLMGGGTFSGSTKSEDNAAALPAFAVNYNLPCCRRLGFHFGMSGMGGFGVEYRQNSANPIQAPQPAGFGKIQSDYEMLRIPIGISYRATSRLFLGLSVIPCSASLRVGPAPFATPNADGTYPQADRFAQVWGFAAQFGVHYQATRKFGLGLSITSPTWFETHKWNSVDHLGADRKLSFDLDFPMIVSAGVSWQVTPGTLIAADIRWIDYENTDGFSGDSGFNSDGSVDGFGWKSIFSFHAGIQQKLGARWTVRMGYNYSENPVPDSLSFFNMPAPAIVQHHLTFGASYKISKRVTLNMAYYHAFENSITGPIHGPTGPIAGSSVKSALSEDAVSLGITLNL